MILKMFTVYDSKAEAYNQPFYMRSKGEALRAWHSTVNDKTTQFYTHPADYTLFEIGEFDDSTGNITIYQAKHNLGNAMEFKNREVEIQNSPAQIHQIQENTLQQ